MKHLGIFVTALFPIAMAACSSGGSDTRSTPATTQDYDDVAQALGATVVTTSGGGDVGSLSDSVDLSLGVPPLGITLAASGEFVGSRVGLDYRYALKCSDASGAAMPACTPATATAKVSVDWSGELAVSTFSASMMRQGDWTLSGLQSDTVTFAGDGTFSFDAHFQSAFRPAMVDVHLDYDAHYDGVTMQRALHRVTGGAIHYGVTAEHSASGTNGASSGRFQMRVDLTFAADGAARLVLDGSHHYAVDASSGTVTRTSG